MSKTQRKSKARQRIIETAEKLFYAEGIRSVGIDRIIAEADVAKMTLYNHFASKDELVLAVLQYREEVFDSYFETGLERYVSEGKTKLEAFFETLKDWFESPGFRGCSFINATVELADCTHPASLFSTEHKQKFHQMIKQIVIESEGETAASHASTIAVMVEGAIVTAVMNQSSEPAEVARKGALALVSP